MGKVIKPLEEKISKLEITELTKRLKTININPTVDIEKFAVALKKINPLSLLPFEKLPIEIQESVKSLSSQTKRFHGAKIALSWFPFPMVFSPCSDKFGYLTSATVRQSSKLDFNIVTIGLMNQLGDMMGNSGRDVGPDSTIPSGYTYFGQFVDHDITLDVSSSLDASTDATTINNMRNPSLDLDNVYGRGPALDPFLYEFPATGPSTAIKLKLGSNQNNGKGGPSTSGGGVAGMAIKTDFDVPRVSGTNTAIIGDPRNDENLFVAQFQMAMLRFHNAVIDLVATSGFTGDIFVESKKIVTQHYQWAVVNDYLKRICGALPVTNALGSVTAPIGSGFSMPVEFSVAAYRFGHSLIRDRYWINHNFINQPLSDAFNFIRNPHLPVRSNWVVDFNAFFPTGVPVPIFNRARKIDSILANGLESLPGATGIMAMLAARNLRRGLAMGLPSGQAAATALGITPMTTAELLTGLDAAETALLNSNGGLLLSKTPLWYYILREAAVFANGDTLGPLGAKIVAETFIKILKRDSESYLNKSGGFTPFLPSVLPGDFTVSDLIKFSGVNMP
jgi:Animal haem peroxidase